MSGKPIVHIVDDNEDWRDSMSSLLDSVGIPATTYASAHEFLDAYDRDDHGCLIVDLRMPGMSGLELQRELAALKGRPHIIFVTGHANVSVAVRAMRDGAVDFFEKPVDEQALLDRVQVVLRDIKAKSDQEGDDARLDESLEQLTPRQNEVLEFLLAGFNTRDIASRLDVGVRTIETYRSGILAKTGFPSMTNLLLRLKERQSED